MSFKQSLKQAVVYRVLPVVSTALAPLRLKLIPANAPNRTFAEFMRHLDRLDFRPRTIIDVGVAHGSPGLHDPRLGAMFYLVDPDPELVDTLPRLAQRLGGEAFNVAAGDFDGEAVLNKHAVGSGSSFYKQQEGAALDGEPVGVPVRRLDTLLPRDMARPVLLKIDTQGHELAVIEGADGIIDQVDVVIAEASFNEYRKGIPEIDDLTAKMRSLGFRTYEILEGHYRPADGALGQVDVVFVKEDSPLRRYKAAHLPSQVAGPPEVLNATEGRLLGFFSAHFLAAVCIVSVPVYVWLEQWIGLLMPAVGFYVLWDASRSSGRIGADELRRELRKYPPVSSPGSVSGSG